MVKVYAGIAALAVLAGAGYGLTQYGRALERADNNEIIAELQRGLMDLGLAIQKQEGEAADNARKLIESDQERVDAIATNDHNNDKIKHLQGLLDESRKKSEAEDTGTVPDDLHYRVIITDSTVRVWNEARSSGELPASDAPSVLQKRLPAITGDDINRAIKFCIGEYNACGVKYNELWRAGDRITEQCNKKRPE